MPSTVARTVGGLTHVLEGAGSIPLRDPRYILPRKFLSSNRAMPVRCELFIKKKTKKIILSTLKYTNFKFFPPLFTFKKPPFFFPFNKTLGAKKNFFFFFF